MIFVTLVVQGLTLPPLIRRLGVVDDGDRGGGEELRARLAAPRPRSTRLDELARRGLDARRHASSACAACTSSASAASRPGRARSRTRTAIEDRSLAYQRMVREVLDGAARRVVELRNEGEISNEVMHRVERELDLEDERLEI